MAASSLLQVAKVGLVGAYIPSAVICCSAFQSRPSSWISWIALRYRYVDGASTNNNNHT